MKGLPLAIILSLVLWAGIVYAIKAVAVEVEPTYNNPTTFEEKAKPQQTPVEDAEPECD